MGCLSSTHELTEADDIYQTNDPPSPDNKSSLHKHINNNIDRDESLEKLAQFINETTKHQSTNSNSSNTSNSNTSNITYSIGNSITNKFKTKNNNGFHQRLPSNSYNNSSGSITIPKNFKLKTPDYDTSNFDDEFMNPSDETLIEQITNSIDDDPEISQSLHKEDDDDEDDDNSKDDEEDEEEEDDRRSISDTIDEEEPYPAEPTDITDDQKYDLQQLSNITYKCIQSSFATQSGTKNGKSKINQDSYFIYDSFGPQSLFQLYGVADGHGPDGHLVSKYVVDNLPKILLNELNNSFSSISSILINTFKLLEKQLISDKLSNKITFDIDYSGTTTTMGLICGNIAYIANIGDSRTVVGKIPGSSKKSVPKAIALSIDHDPKNSEEAKRINLNKTATIIIDDDGDARIQIEIPQIIQNNHHLETKSKSRHKRTQSVKKISASVSRSIGDQIAHKYGGLISEPEINIHEFSNDDIFIIFASDGIWTMIENDDVMRVIGIKLNTNKNIKIYDELDKVTKRLVNEANISWKDEYEDYTDDITAVVARIGNIKKI